MDMHHPTHFKAHDLPPHHAIKKPRSSTNTTWIIIVCVLFFFFLIWNKKDQVSNFLGLGEATGEVSSSLVFGETISIEGQLSSDGDFVTHTHKLYTLSNGVFGLKSKTVNLNQYTGTISLEGVVEGERDGVYIIEVTQVFTQISSSSTGLVTTGASSSQGIYLPKAGVYLTPGFDGEYTLDNNGENGKIKLTHTTNNQKLVISYFACKKGDANKDCKQLVQTFGDTNEKSFTTVNGDTFYKLPEVHSWFVANDSLFGYFINDVSDEEVIAISKYIVLPTTDYISSQVVSQVNSLCKEGNIAMTVANKSNLYLEGGSIVLKVSGTWENGTAECKIKIDPSLSAQGTLIQFTYVDSTVTTGSALVKPAATASSSLSVEAGVKQFPISLDKTLEYSSSRGHTVIFPSRRISYQASSVSTDLGVKGIRCSSQIGVVDYANKDVVGATPAVKIYECTIKSGVSVPTGYIDIALEDGRTFVVEVVDSAWVDFANNVKVILNN